MGHWTGGDASGIGFGEKLQPKFDGFARNRIETRRFSCKED